MNDSQGIGRVGHSMIGQVTGQKRFATVYIPVLLLPWLSNQLSAQTVTVNGPGTSFFQKAPWTAVASAGPSTIPFARLTGVSYTLNAGVEISQNFSGSGLHTISGSETLSLLRNGTPVAGASAFLFPHGSGFGSGRVAGFDSTTVTGSIPLSSSSGNFSLQASSGSGPNLQSIGSVTFTYTYTPIGLTQSDPILPTSISNGNYMFSSVPSGRWFDPPTIGGFKYTITSPGDSFKSITGFPTGFNGSFDVSGDGIDYGHFTAGGMFNFPAGVTSFTISDINPKVNAGDTSAFPIDLAFNRDGVSFSASPLVSTVPEVKDFWVMIFPCLFWMFFRNRQRD